MKNLFIFCSMLFLMQVISASDTLTSAKKLSVTGVNDSIIYLERPKTKLKTTTSINYCDYIDCKIYAHDGQYLGKTSQNQFDTESIINDYGNYGSQFSSTSIRNSFSNYGSQFSNLSPYNSFTSTPPVLYKFNSLTQNWEIVAYITKNTFLYTGTYPKLDPDILISTLINGTCLPSPIVGYPDIIVNSIYIEETDFNVGDSITFHFTILNNSSYSVINTFFIELWQDLTLVDIFYVDNLPPLNYVEGIIRLKITEPIHIIGVYADVFDNVLESIEYNNELIMYSFAYIPDLVLQNIQLEFINDSIKIDYNILNNGLAIANDSLTVRIAVNENEYDIKKSINLDINQNIILSDNIHTDVDTNKVIIFVDWYNSIIEIDDINNNIGFNFIFLDLNSPPYFTSTQLTSATENAEYSYNISAEDDEGDAIIITAPIKPDWLEFTDNGDGTALLEGTPLQADTGSNSVKINISDTKDSTDQTFNILVDPASNTPPYFTSTQLTSATENAEYSYNISAEDDEGDAIIITAPIKPDWLEFSDNGDGTALLEGTPLQADTGLNSVKIIISDTKDSTDQTFNLFVEDYLTSNSAFSKSFKIYPNPVRNKLIIESNFNSDISFKFILYNSLCQEIFVSESCYNNTIEIAFDSFPESFYILEIYSSKNYIRKLIIKK